MGKEIMLYLKQTVDGDIRIDKNIGVVRRGDIAPLCTVVNEDDKAIIYEELSTYQRRLFNGLYVIPVKCDMVLFETVTEIIGRRG